MGIAHCDKMAESLHKGIVYILKIFKEDLTFCYG